ncbi:MAG: hypothetical protein RLZZ262_2303 [Bacteroidota bacterium]|jgi:isochorismate synthase
MGDTTLREAIVALPVQDETREVFQLSSFQGKIWVQDTAYYGNKPSFEIGIEAYQNLIEQAVDKMQTSELEKVVLSRLVVASTPTSITSQSIFEQLCIAYPMACVFQFETPSGEEWLGATPEKLIVRRGNQFSTIALAGTRSVDQNVPWTDKEIHEELVVKDYIVSVLWSFGAADIVVSERYERRAGHLIHLAHDITFTSEETVGFWTAQLHPTPAVCGLPKALAMDYIRQNEPHGRGFYTGLLGIEQPNGDADVYVLLRCARRNEAGFVLYVGGGITAGSNWSDEYAETVLKSDIFRNVLMRS